MANNTEYNNGTYNRVSLIGRIADLTISPGSSLVNGTQAESLNVRGTVQIGDDPSFKVPFSWWQRSLKANGDINEKFGDFLDWANGLESISKGGEGTRVWLMGSYQTNDYVNRNGVLVRGFTNRINWQRVVTPDKADGCEIDFDGMITSIEPEDKEGTPTGRLIVKVCGLNYEDVAVPIEFIVPQNLVLDFQSVYAPESTGRFYLTMGLEAEEKEESRGGIGEVRVTEGYARRVLYMTGAEFPYTPSDANNLSCEAVQEGRTKYAAKLKEMKNEGYKGGNKENSVTQRSGIGQKAKAAPATVTATNGPNIGAGDEFDIDF